MLALSACSTLSNSPTPGQRTLPDKPTADFTRTVPLPAIAAGIQPVVLAGQCLVKLDTANDRIVKSWGWYAELQREFGKGP